MRAQTTFPTVHADRYLGTLCKHFGHKVATGQQGRSGWIELPFATCTLEASDTALDLTVAAATEPALDDGTAVIGSHLERFAFRERPNLEWRITRATQS